MKLFKELIGAGDKIMLTTLPFLVTGLILNFLFPHFFSVGGPSEPLKTVSIIILFFGIIIWLWSAILIVLKVPKNELITYGPYALNKHPIYNGVAFLVLPWLGFLLNSWLGVAIGIALYTGSRIHSPKEEARLAETFGQAWDEYVKTQGLVKFIMNLIKKYPVLSYFLFTFLISWGAILVLIAFNGMPDTVAEAQAQLPLAIMTFLLGPFISGLMMIGLVQGRSGYHYLWSRMIKWRINLVWYAIALLLAPLVFVAAHFFLSLFSKVYLPGFLTITDGSSLIFMGIMSGIMVGILEEVGWSGFAIPEMRKRYSPLAVGLIVGIIWGAWHIMANDIWAIKTYSGEIPTVQYAILSGFSFLIGQLPPFRILMVWAYERTGSLLLMVVMHFSLTACSIAFSPAEMTGWQVFIYSLSIAAIFWVIAAVVVIAEHRISTVKQPSRRHAPS